MLNGKVYIGQTVRTLNERIAEHKRKRNSLLGQAIRKYGDACFSFEIIDEAGDIETLNEKEKYWITFYDCEVPNGYNQCNGGANTAGYHHKDSSKEKMRIAKKRRIVELETLFMGRNIQKKQRQK